MGRGLGKIQKRVLEVLSSIEGRWISKKDFEEQWVSLHIVVIKTYHPEQLNGSKGRFDWNYSKNEHRRIWESVKTLEKRGLVKVRIGRIKGSGWETRFGGIQRWMEVRRI